MAPTADPVALWRHRLAADRDDGYWLENTRRLIELARTRPAADLRGEMKNYVYWVGVCASRPEVVDGPALSEFIEQFARLAGNLGEPGDAGVVTALDRAVRMCATAGTPTTRLYLAKAAYFAALHNESDRRREALEAALASAAPGSAAWADAVLALCWYHIEVSRYDLALALVEELRGSLPPELLAARYECGALAYSGAALFSSFQDLGGAARNLRLACTYEERAGNDDDIGRWVATAYHYRGRLAEVRRAYATALGFYLRGKEIHERCPDDLYSIGCVHLRIAELLISAGRRAPAHDHLNRANELFRTCSNQSIGRLQVDLAYATLDAADGRYDTAIATVHEARTRSRDLGFWRGELLCLGYLLALGIRSRRVGGIPRVLLDVLRTTRGGELGRNRLFRLLAHAPVMLPVVVRRIFHRRYRPPDPGEDIVTCPCRLHPC